MIYEILQFSVSPRRPITVVHVSYEENFELVSNDQNIVESILINFMSITFLWHEMFENKKSIKLKPKKSNNQRDNNTNDAKICRKFLSD